MEDKRAENEQGRGIASNRKQPGRAVATRLFIPLILCLTFGIIDTNSILPTDDIGGRDNDERIAVKNA